MQGQEEAKNQQFKKQPMSAKWPMMMKDDDDDYDYDYDYDGDW